MDSSRPTPPPRRKVSGRGPNLPGDGTVTTTVQATNHYFHNINGHAFFRSPSSVLGNSARLHSSAASCVANILSGSGRLDRQDG